MRRRPVALGLVGLVRLGLVGVGLALVLIGCQPPPSGVTAPTGIRLRPSASTIEVGRTLALDARVQPAAAAQLVNWTSDAVAVASVDTTGLVTGIAVGTATITATSAVDARVAASAVITVADGGSDLVPGGSVEGPDGVTLYARPGALDAPVSVQIERLPERDITTPLPAALTPVGYTYHVRADVGTLVADMAGTGFLLGLPVPTDDVPADLNVGFYLSGETIARWYPDHPPDQDVWEVVPAAYDADLGQWVVGLHVLLEEGYGIVLAAGAYFSEAPAPVAPTSATGVSFHVRCHREDVWNACSSSNTEAYAAALAAAHDTFTGLGFPYPMIASRYPLGFGPPTAYLYGFVTDDAGVRWCNWIRDAAGYYNPVTANVVVCLSHYGFTDFRESVTWHEYFHAVQHAYPFMLQPVIRRLWILEGTATVAEGVLEAVRGGASVEDLRERHDLVHRVDEGKLREVDVGLREQGDAVEYRTQDFWVFVGKLRDQGVPWLRNVLAVGYHPFDVGAAFYDTFDGWLLSEAYWAWVKNQVFEKTVDLGGAAFSAHPEDETVDWPMCRFDPRTATAIEARYRPPAPARWSTTLPPLTSAVFELVLEPGSEDYDVEISVDDNAIVSFYPHDDVMVKFYDAIEAGSAACRARPDARTHVVTVPRGSSRTVYALVSNTRVGASAAELLSLRVDLHVGRVDGGPTIGAITGQVDDPLGFGAFDVGLYRDDEATEERKLASGTISATGAISIPLYPLADTQVDRETLPVCGWRPFVGAIGAAIISDVALDYRVYTARAVYTRTTPRAVDGKGGWVVYVYSRDAFHEVCTGEPMYGAPDVDVRIEPGWNVVTVYYDLNVDQMFWRSGEPDFDVPWHGPFALVD